MRFSDHLLTGILLGCLALIALCVGLAVAALVFRLRNERELRRWTRLEARWETRLLEILDGNGAIYPLIEGVQPREIPYLLAFVVRFARRVKGPEQDRLREAAGPLLDFADGQVGASSPEIRARGIEAIGLLGGGDRRATLVVALDDPAPLVALTAIRALARFGGVDSAEEVLARLDRFKALDPRFLSALLAAFGTDAEAALRATLGDRARSAPARTMAAEALGRLGDLPAADVAARIAVEEDGNELVTASLRLLARVGRPEHLPAVLALLDSPTEMIRVGAIQALVVLAGAAELPRLQHALEDPSPWVAEHAARGLARGPGRPALEAIALSEDARAIMAREALAAGRE